MEKVLKTVKDLILSNNIGTNPVDLVDGMSIQFDYPGTNGIVIKRTNRISLADYDTTKTTDEEKKVKYNNLIILKGASNADSISFSMTGKNKAADIYSWVKDKLENQTYDEELLTMIKEIKSKAELSKANYLKTDVNSFHISREIEDFKNSFRYRSLVVKINEIVTEDYVIFSVRRSLKNPDEPVVLVKSIVDTVSNTKLDQDFKIENVTSDIDSEVVFKGMETIDKLRGKKDEDLANELEKRLQDI
jgi:hypothetical protein